MAGTAARVAERRAMVLKLRSAGMTWKQIAEVLAPDAEGRYEARHAFADGRAALKTAQEHLAGMAELHLALELERLDSYRRIAETVLEESRDAGDRLGTLRSVDRLVKIGQRQDSLLGLSKVTVEATRATESGGERPHASDSTDEFSRRRAARRIAK
jgi:hypothetical protein